MKKFISITAILITLTAIGFFLLTRNDSQVQTSESTSSIPESMPDSTAVEQAPPSVTEATLILGKADAPVTIVEYADYKCPNCHRFHLGAEQEIFEKYGDQVHIEVRITPIIGPDSGRAGRGAYCANEQSLFTDYHQAIMAYIWNTYYSSGNFAAEFEDILTTDKLSALLADTSLDEAAFRACVDSDKYNPKLDKNLLDAADDSIRGTPGFVVGGQSFVGVQPLSVFSALIDKEL